MAAHFIPTCRGVLLMLTAAALIASCEDDETIGGGGQGAAPGGAGAVGGAGLEGGATSGGGGQGGSSLADCSVIASPTGSGSTCTATEPCALEAARTLARAEAADMQADVVVCLHGGTYALDETFELDGEQDSGRNGHQMVYQAVPGERPVLSGGVVIAAWQPASGSVQQATTPLGLQTRQLYVDGRRAQRARGPSTPAGFQETATGYQAPDASMASWGNPGDIEVVALQHWKAFRCSVASISGPAITMDEPCWSYAQWHTPFDMSGPSWIENALELLDQPGEWYLDGAAGVVYYHPRAGEDLTSAEVIAPRLQTLIALRGTAESPITAVRLEGLSFAHSTWLGPSSAAGYPALQAGHHLVAIPPDPLQVDKTPGAVVLEYARQITLERNRFERLGSTGLVIEHGRDNVIAGNLFRDLSGGGVHLGDVDQPNPADDDQVLGNVIRDNFLGDTGQELFDTVGIFVGYAADTLIEHNELANLPYTGISVGWGWTTNPSLLADNVVRHNLVHHVMQRLMDGGCVYTLSSQPGTIIEQNYFHDLLDLYGGIYLDQGSQHMMVQDNVVASVPYWYLLQPQVAPPAQDNTVQNNFSDTAESYCCGGLGCCTDINTIGPNTVVSPGVPTSWPAPAVTIMSEAGLSAEYADVHPGLIRIEAEDYLRGGEGVGYHDLLSGNQGGAYRSDDVDLYGSVTRSNEVVVGYTQTGEWLHYYVDLPTTGTYEIAFVVGTQADGDAVEVDVDGAAVGTVSLPNTGSWNTFDTAVLGNVPLDRGPHLLRLTFTGGFNLDYVSLRRL